MKYKVRDAAMTQKSEPLTPRNTGGNPGSAGERGVGRTQSTYLNTNEIFVLSNSLGKKRQSIELSASDNFSPKLGKCEKNHKDI